MTPFEYFKMMRVILVTLVILVGCTNKEQSASGDQYTCPMHPTVVSDHQGTCPVCGMDLVRKAREGEEVKITEDLARLLQSPDETVVANVKTIRGEYRRMPLRVSAPGVVTYDPRFTHEVTVRVGGRLEKVSIHFPFQRVRVGQRLAEIYSPELLTAQKELLLLLSSDPSNTELINLATKKLLLLGATSDQVNELMRTKETNANFVITSPYDGYAFVESSTTSLEATPAAESMQENDMAGGQVASSKNLPAARASMIHEGDYLARGGRLLSVVSLSALRLELNVPSGEAGEIKAGDSVAISLNQGPRISGKVDFVQPFFEEGTEFQKVRLYVRNADLRVGQLVDATIHRASEDRMWLPNEAVTDLGTDRIVFVKERGVFKPRKILTGLRSDGWVEILGGIASSDEVAAKAAYLVDSESFVKTK
ncbi:MAG: efflux RND transporter periplasmic adaptor subunit [Cyclobacteriaceae bacterium]|nr:efflux RND transporter periplasmic adaptor subunit [Cyclobacteriaceae bacterium]